MKTTRTSASACLNCGEPINMATAADGDWKPTPGDVSVCLHCSYVAIFADDLTVREATDAEMVEMAGMPELLRAVEVTGRYRAETARALAKAEASVMKFKPRSGFDWAKLTWGRPHSMPSVLCSYCSAAIPEESVPLILNSEGWTVRFCEACMQTWWGFPAR